MAAVRRFWQSAAVVPRLFDGTPRGGSLVGLDGRGGPVSGTETAVVRTRVSVLETDEARTLLEAGKESGSLSADEITLALDDLDLDSGQIDDFYQALDELQIEVVQAADEEDDAVAEEVQAQEVSTDALQLFLKDVGRVDLLTAAQEVELAKRIERGDHRAKQEMVEA